MSELKESVVGALDYLRGEKIARDMHSDVQYRVVLNELHRLTAELAKVKAERDALREIGGLVDMDTARIVLWRAISNSKIGNKTDDKRILRELGGLGYWIVKLPDDRARIVLEQEGAS